MRSFGFRLSLLVAILLAGAGSTAWALGLRGEPVETVYVMPSSLTLPYATSYVVSTSWVEPTAYAVPTYYTTAYWMDPVVLAQPTYAPTAYVRRGGLFGRRWVVEQPVLASYTTSYVPTAYYASPSYRATSLALADRLVVPSAFVSPVECICPPVLASAAPTYAAPSPGYGAGTSGTGSQSRARQGQASVRESVPSDVGPPPNELSPLGSRGTRGEADNAAQEQATGRATLPAEPLRDNTQPAPSAGSRPQSASPQGTTTQGGQGQTPTRTGGGQGQQGGGQGQQGGGQGQQGGGQGQQGGGQRQTGGTRAGDAGQTTPVETPPPAPGGPELPAPGDAETRRESFRPSNYAMRPARPKYANVLLGTVFSSSDGQPEADVRIGVRNAATGGAKAITSDALGRFAIRLPDGDWAVDVTMPSGRVYEVSQLHIVNGAITDGLGRRIPSLEITR
jgi:hypothetical protein